MALIHSGVQRLDKIQLLHHFAELKQLFRSHGDDADVIQKFPVVGDRIAVGIAFDCTKEELGKAIGRGEVAVVGITDAGFARAIQNITE